MLSAKTTKICRHRTFKSEFIFLWLVLFSNILISGTLYPLLYITAAAIHESGHILAIYSLGHNIDSVKFVGFGIRIKNKQIYSYRKELLISIMGPAANVIVAILFFIVALLIKGELLNHFIVANLLYAFINLIPLPPLDGYKILCDCLFNKFSLHIANKFIRIYSVFLVVALFLALTSLLIHKYSNVSLYITIIILIFSAILRAIKK